MITLTICPKCYDVAFLFDETVIKSPKVTGKLLLLSNSLYIKVNKKICNQCKK